MKKLIAACLLASLFSSCTKNVPTTNEVAPEKLPEVKTFAEINSFIKTTLEANGKFEWSSAPDDIIWSALQKSDNIASIGYKPSAEGDINNKLHTIDITKAEWLAAKQQVLQIIYEEESKLNPSLQKNNMEIWQENVLPLVDVEIKSITTIKKLRASSLIRYVEPMGYEPEKVDNNNTANGFNLSSSGCGSNTADNTLVNNVHYTVATPNTKVGWNYAAHGIQNAWAKSTGAGIKVFIIDTGCEYDQENLGSAFNQGNSSGRTVEKIVTLPRSTFLGIPTGSVETPDDGCGHGTSMAGACAAPRGTDGNTCGIAYNCNLVTCRAGEDVLIDASREAKGVADAYVNAANRTDVKIISMSMGRLTSSGQIEDAIRYANGKGKLMFCAGGTSFSWSASWYGVIFPAWMPEVQAVTGVKQNTAFTNCDACHKGSEIDFVVIMEKAGDNFHPLSLAMSGDVPSTVGGSSVATASCAGMAAIVWSKFPSYNAAQIVDKLKMNSSNYPTKTAEYGWGTPNVDAATN
jgi:subtilisin family serine protease